MKKLLLLTLAGCYLHSYPVTPSIAESATYKVFNGEAQGTAWAVSDHELVTAGHVCETMSDNFVIVGPTRRFHAHPILWEMSADGVHDACVLHTDVAMDTHLIIADRMPAIGDTVRYVGYPQGEFISLTGKYLGDLDGPDLHLNDYVVSTPSDHGASGSALFTPEGVFGVLVRVRTDPSGTVETMHDGSDGAAVIPLATLRKLLDDAGVSYDTTPHLPPRLEGNPGGLPVRPAPMIGE